MSVALVEIGRDGARREWRFGEVAGAAPAVAARLAHSTAVTW